MVDFLLRECCLIRVRNEKSQLFWIDKNKSTQISRGERGLSGLRMESWNSNTPSSQGSDEAIWDLDWQHLEIVADTEDEDSLLEIGRLLHKDLREQINQERHLFSSCRLHSES